MHNFLVKNSFRTHFTNAKWVANAILLHDVTYRFVEHVQHLADALNSAVFIMHDSCRGPLH